MNRYRSISLLLVVATGLTMSVEIGWTQMSGTIVTVAGNGTRGFSGDGGLATQASLNQPTRVFVDRDGTLYIGDPENHRIRKVDTGGIITTIAGNGSSGFAGDGGLATQARLYFPWAVFVTGEGTIYIADTSNQRIRKVDTNGVITTIAGTGNAFGPLGDGGPATQASFYNPTSLFVDETRNLYFTDQGGHRIRKVDSNGIITTIAGSGPTGYENGSFAGDGGLATQARLDSPSGLFVDKTGNLYLADTGNQRIRKVDTNGVITTIAGSGPTGFNNGGFFGDGGLATQARLDLPTGLAMDGTGNLFIADLRNERIRKVDVNGVITTVAGGGNFGNVGEGGPATQAYLSSPTGVYADQTGNFYIANQGDHRIRKIISPPAPIINVDPLSLDFGTVAAGTVGGPALVTIDNNGTAPLTVALSTNHPAYTVTPENFTVAPGAAQVVQVFFSPTAAGLVDGTLQAHSNDSVIPLVQVTLKGQGIAPALTVDPLSLDFGTVIPGQTQTAMLTIFNPGTATLTVSQITVDGNDAGLFRVSPTNVSVAAGASDRVSVTFAPTAAGVKTATLRLQHNAVGSPTLIPLTGGGLRIHLQFTDAFTRPGSQAIVLVELDTSTEVAGIQFKVQPRDGADPTPDVRFHGIINDMETEGFTASSATDANGITTVLLFSPSGATLPLGERTVLQLVYDISPDIAHGKVIDLAVWNDLLSDPSSRALVHTMQPGKIQIGQRGDLAGGPLGDGDGQIDILDVIKEVQVILGLLPTPSGFARFVADPNDDGAINILDLVWMVNRILGGETKVIADRTMSPVTVNLGDPQPLTSGQTAIPVTMRTDGVIAGVQASFRFDAARLQPGLPQAIGRAEGMTVESRITDGTLRVVVYSVTGRVIAPGDGPALLIPVTLLGEPGAMPTLTLSEMVLADRGARAVPVTLGTTAVKVSIMPAAFTLKPNHPNPFNPATQIAYEVPQTAHVTLTVYNLLGQEVFRLVDVRQPPGRYVVVWDGRNAQGMGVASGVYLYRMTTSTGFTQTRRMTLVK
ncbi:MAG: choice-of-anchor D domain-containing protein [Candidatus Latescibacteria bacterium]|nr:choice-of-anchor D domain-containing protein [Candidatus Latescibacterota bacterium]